MNGHFVIKLSAAGDLVQAFHFIAYLKQQQVGPVILITQKAYLGLGRLSQADQVYADSDFQNLASFPQKSWTIWDLQSSFSKKSIVKDIKKRLKDCCQIQSIRMISVSFPSLWSHRLQFRWTPQKNQPSSVQNKKGSLPSQQRRQLSSHLETVPWLTPSELFKIEKIPDLLTELPPFVLWAPGASQTLKRLPVESWIEWFQEWFQEEDTLVFAVGWNEEEKNLIRHVQSHFSQIQMEFESPFENLVSLIFHSKLVWAMDSVVGHISANLRKPSLIWLGPTTASQGYWTEKQPWIQFVEQNLNCRPCSRFGKRLCYYENHACFKSLRQVEQFKKHHQWMRRVLNAGFKGYF
jgi:ADP-heptose:LPS heptosyltransferase